MIDDLVLTHEVFGLSMMLVSVVVSILRNDRIYVVSNSVLALGWGVNFLLINAYSAAAVDFLIFFRTIAAIYFPKRVWLCNLFVVLFMVAGVMTYVDIKDVFPIVATIIATLGFFYLGGWRLRLLIVASNTLWVIHNVLAGSMSGSIHKVIQVVLGVYAAAKMRSEESQQGLEKKAI